MTAPDNDLATRLAALIPQYAARRPEDIAAVQKLIAALPAARLALVSIEPEQEPKEASE